MDKIRNILKSKTGSFAIIFVIICFITMLLIMGFTEIMQKLFSINEIQGVLDDAGVASLHMGIDDNNWREEGLIINETQVLSNFHKLVRNTLKQGGDSVLKDYTVDAKIIPPNDSRMKSLGIPKGQRNQYYLVSEAYARYEGNPIFDKMAFSELNFFNFFSNYDDKIQYNGTVEDGNTEIVVRSVVRLVLR